MQVELRPWSTGDLPVLERANTPEMTVHLGGPESAQQVRDRHERYLRLNASGEARMLRIDVDGEPAGGIGYWTVEHDGAPAFEAGWSVEPRFQGRGVAREALRLLTHLVAADGRRGLLVAYPGADNAASNGLCRGAGFEDRGVRTQPWRGGELTFRVWVLDVSPLDLAGRIPAVEERFDGEDLDRARWWPYYTPHWASRDAAAARWTVGPGGLRLRIDDDTAPWAPELDGDLRVSHVQTGQY
ncbi:MAG: GNAT family N-acetyltransferase, partial [Microbacterium sp.]